MMISTKNLRISMMKWIYTILIKKLACIHSVHACATKNTKQRNKQHENKEKKNIRFCHCMFKVIKKE